MKTIHNAEELKSAIIELERKKNVEEAEIKYQFKQTYEALKPANILKNTVSEVAASPKFRHNLLNIAIGLGAGYLSKKVVVGRSAGLLKRTLGTALQFGVASLISKRESTDGEPVKKGGLFKRIFSR
jgi:hypothetical protein